MPFRIKITFIAFGAILLILFVGPLIVPIRALETVPLTSLADPDSLFIEVDGLNVHYKERGVGEPHFILLHGFGASTFSWEGILGALGEHGQAVAFDRPAFGLTERPMRGQWRENPYTPEAQIDLTLGLMDALGMEQAILVGNSAGGTIATEIALRHPERVAGLVLVNAAIYTGGGAPQWVRPLLGTPQLNRLGPLVMRQLGGQGGLEFLRASWSDPDRITDATYEAYRRPLQVDGWDRALWELTKASREGSFEGRLGALAVPTLIISGEGDRIIPLEHSERLVSEVAGSSLVVLSDCGHVPQEECPEATVEAIRTWLVANGFSD